MIGPELTDDERRLLLTAARAAARPNPMNHEWVMAGFSARDEDGDAVTVDALRERGLLEVDWRVGRYRLAPGPLAGLHRALALTPSLAGVALGSDEWPARFRLLAERLTATTIADGEQL